MVQIYKKNDFGKLKIEFFPGDIVFLHGDLAAGKTTLSQYFLNTVLGIDEDVRSPTYTYYNKYRAQNGQNIFHFDLYRLQKYDEFFAIGGEEILDTPENISFIEWPEILEKYYKPTLEIFLRKTDNPDEREIEIKDYRK